MDDNKDACFSVMFEFYPKQVDEATCSLNKNPDPDETHRLIGKQVLELMNAVRAAKKPEKFLRTHGDRRFDNPGMN